MRRVQSTLTGPASLARRVGEAPRPSPEFLAVDPGQRRFGTGVAFHAGNARYSASPTLLSPRAPRSRRRQSASRDSISAAVVRAPLPRRRFSLSGRSLNHAHPGHPHHSSRAVRNFGRFGDAVEVPPLTDVQTRSYDRFLQLDVPPDKRDAHGPGRRAARNLPDRELRQDALPRVSSSTNSASRATAPTSAASSASPTAGRSASGCGSTRSSRSRKKSTSATCRS